MMNKRAFLKTSGAAPAAAAFPGAMQAKAHNTAPSSAARTNWAGCYTYTARHLDQPADADAVRGLVTGHARVKALGSRHSFNGIADTPGDQLELTHLDAMTLDRATQTVTVGAGVRYGRLAPWLDAQGFAVHNLASLPHITVVGACMTATHGSGLGNGNLATAVLALEMVTGTGELVRLSRAADPEIFDGAVVALGSLGVVTAITLRVVPSFGIAQTVYEDLSFDQLEHNLRAIFSAGYSVSLFTDWQGNAAQQVWLKQRSDGTRQPRQPLFFGATVQQSKLHPLAGHDPVNCTEQMGVPGPWYQRLPHFKMEFTPSSGAEIQSEFFVPFDRAYDAIRAVEALRDRITPHLFVTELRTVAADDLWLSMAYGRESLALHFTWKPEIEAVRDVLPAIEEALGPLSVRPHWGKVFTMSPDRLRTQYPRWNDFRALVHRYDPQGRFMNDVTAKLFG